MNAIMNRFPKLLRRLGCYTALVFGPLVVGFALPASAATVTTDRPDYRPGDTVLITGSGFGPTGGVNDTVTVRVVHVGSGDTETSPAHLPWTVLADASGNFWTVWVVPIGEDELGATLQVTATGLPSLSTATAFFTDAAACAAPPFSPVSC